MRGTIEVGHGPRHVEAGLLTALQAEFARVPLGSTPLRVVVPSRSLAEHLSAALVRTHGRALLGVRVQTLSALANELLDDAGVVVLEIGLGFPWLVRQAASREPNLADRLLDLDGGFAPVVATVSDLLDAGLEPEAAGALESALGSGDVARALVRVAAAVALRMRALGVGREGERLAAAAELLRHAPERLAGREPFVHGFADATGRASDLLEVLAKQCGARIYVDRPPDPDDPDGDDVSADFVEPLCERIGGRPSPLRPDRPEATELTLLRARGPEPEVRAVAERARAALARGVPAERIGIVARALEPYRFELRTQLDRLGIPFSGCGARGPRAPEARAMQALLELLRRGSDATLDAFLDVLALGPWEPGARAERATQLAKAGAMRLRDAAEVEDRVAMRIAAVLAADDLHAPPSSHCATLDALLRALGAHPTPLLQSALDALDGLPDEIRVDRHGFAELLAQAIGEQDRVSLGGAGGGVQVLDVTEARARTFDELYVLGGNRDVFPRVIQHDPLLSDSERGLARAVLPDLPRKSRGHREERYLYAQLLASSARTTVSWLVLDDDAKVLQPSSFVTRHLLARRDRPVEVAATRASETALELALAGGLALGHDRVEERTALWLAERDPAQPPDERRALAQARAELLAEIDPRHPVPPHRSPFFGGLGRLPSLEGEERIPAVTALERYAVCPWQTFLQRRLKLEPPRDPQDLLPALDPRIVGNAVHDALERIALRAGVPRGGDLEDALARGAVRVDWPDESALQEIAVEAARAKLGEVGVRLESVVLALAERIPPFLERVRTRLFADGPAPVLGVELRGSAGPLRFRADLLCDPTSPTLVDYKTGRLKNGKLQTNMARGEELQAGAYQRAVDAHGGRGAYLYLTPNADDAKAWRAVGPGDREVIDVFERVVPELLDAWEAGEFLPRLEEPNGKSPDACSYCDVADACVRGDSGLLRRLVRTLASAPADDRARRVWEMGRT